MPKRISSPATDWDDMSKSLQHRLDSWSKSSNAARDDAERARSRAEADRNAAEEARDHALMQVVQETGRRVAADEAAAKAERERASLAETVGSQQSMITSLETALENAQTEAASHKEALQLADAERRSLRKDLDSAAKDIVALRRELEKVISVAEDAKRQVEGARSEAATAKEEAKYANARLAESERKATAMAEEARRSVEKLRSGVLLQEGLRAKAEIGMAEATRELSQAQDAATAVAVERRLLKDRLDALIKERDSLAAENGDLLNKLEELSLKLDKMEGQVSLGLKSQLADAQAEVERLLHENAGLTEEAEEAKEQAQVLQAALEEAVHAKQEMRAAWRASEDALHGMSRARAEIERSKHRMTEALVRERAARILAQRELESAATSMEESSGALLDRSSTESALAAVDKARLALWHEEMAAEHKSLELILDALKEMRAATSGEADDGDEDEEGSEEDTFSAK